MQGRMDVWYWRKCHFTSRENADGPDLQETVLPTGRQSKLHSSVIWKPGKKNKPKTEVVTSNVEREQLARKRLFVMYLMEFCYDIEKYDLKLFVILLLCVIIRPQNKILKIKWCEEPTGFFLLCFSITRYNQWLSLLRMLGAKAQQVTPRSWALFSLWSCFICRSHSRRSPSVDPVINIWLHGLKEQATIVVSCTAPVLCRKTENAASTKLLQLWQIRSHC